MHYYKGNPSKLSTFVLFDTSKMGILMTPVLQQFSGESHRFPTESIPTLQDLELLTVSFLRSETGGMQTIEGIEAKPTWDWWNPLGSGEIHVKTPENIWKVQRSQQKTANAFGWKTNNMIS